MKLCIEGDIYFILKFHILETGTVKLYIETGLMEYGMVVDIKFNMWPRNKALSQVGHVSMTNM
jgi:hypothetical protein